MKKMLTMLLVLMMTLTMLPAMAEGSGLNPMPAEMAALFEVPAWREYEVMKGYDDVPLWIYDDSLDAGRVVITKGSL